MSAITPSFMMDLETNMRTITISEYSRLNDSSRLWWRSIAKVTTSQTKKERISWLLETAKIERTARGGGQVFFEDIVSRSMEYENENAAAGLELKKEQLADLDGNGVDLAAHWSRQIGAYSAYWPQKVLAQAILANPTTYDGLAFFHGTHLYNPFNSGAGSFSNNMTAGSGAGAVPIHATGAGAVDIETAINNISKVIAYIASWKMPNGEDPRFLRVSKIFYPPAMRARIMQIFTAKFLTIGNGSADVEGLVKDFGFETPVEVPELGAAFGGSDTTWYVGLEDITGDELGAFMYVDREPFSVIYHGPMTDAQLARIRKFQWTTEGRNTIAPGHPYKFVRCLAA